MGATAPPNLTLRIRVPETHIDMPGHGPTSGNIHRPSDTDSAISIPSSNSDNGDGEERGRKQPALSPAVPMCSTDTDITPANEYRPSFVDSAVSTASSPVADLEKAAASAKEGNQSSKPSAEDLLASFDPDRTIGGFDRLSDGESCFGSKSTSFANIEYPDSRVSFDGGADRLDPIISPGASRLSPGPPNPTTPLMQTRATSLRLSPGRFTTTPTSITRSVSQDDSVIAIEDGHNNDGWNPTALLEFSDALRQVLREFAIPGHKLKDLDALLGLMLSDERCIDRAVDLNVIVHAHWDKLLHDLLNYEGRLGQSDDQLKELLSKASSLEHRWQQRFKTGYFAIDDERLATLKNGEGLLQDVILDPGDRMDGHKWLVRRTNPIAQHPGDLSFKPGDWWLSMFCAYRDGIVGSIDERLTNGPYGVTALPLLTGREIEGEVLGTFKYIKEGSSSEMHFRLLSNFGRNIRILRGYALGSPYAPIAGIRYDGLYTIKHYGHALADADKDIYRCVITLERLGGQTSFNEIRTIPTPSQVDEWVLYNKLMGDDIRAREGDVAYSKWKTLEDQEEKARDMRRIREEWHRHRDFRAGIEHTGCSESEKFLEEE